MTIDVNVLKADEYFLDEIDEIIEDTMVQIFVLRSSNIEELEDVKESVKQHNALFYYAPIEYINDVDEKCIGFLVANEEEAELAKEKVIYVEASNLTPNMIKRLSKNGSRGIILNAIKVYPELKNFFVCINPANIDKFEDGVIAKLPMNKIVLTSSYPNFGFDEIFLLSKKISDKNFRPDQSIISEATRNALILFGFKKS